MSLSKGELYTYLTNKNGRGKKGTLVAYIKGVKSNDLIKTIKKIPLEKRKLVKEVTLDMANNMNLTAKDCFPNTKLVTDRFYAVKLVTEALQHVRIQHRWKAIEDKNKAIEIAKKEGKKYKPTLLSNGDTKKNLLARSRYIFSKKKQMIGLKIKNKEQPYYLICILALKKHTDILWSLEVFLKKNAKQKPDNDLKTGLSIQLN